MSELREFVAELLERKGAAVEATGPDVLDVLAPQPVQRAMGWPELTKLAFAAERRPGAIAIGLEGDWLERFGALLGNEGRLSERQLPSGPTMAAPSDPERVIERALVVIERSIGRKRRTHRNQLRFRQ